MIRRPSLSHLKSRLLRATLMLALIASSPYVLQAADGALDFTFGMEGKVRTDFIAGSYDVGFGAFGNNGIAQADFATPDEDPFDSVSALAIQPDGRIVAAGTTWSYFTTGESNFALARFEANASTLPPPR